MKAATKKRLRRWLGFALLAAFALFLAFCVAVWTGLADRWALRGVVARLEQMTGGRVTLRGFQFHPFSLRAELFDLTIRGSEPEDTLPFFHADYLLVDIRWDSLWRRKVLLDEVRVDRPIVHVRVEADGSSNVPTPKPKEKPARPLRERIFDMTIQQLHLNDGQFLFNDVRVPLVAEGGEFKLLMDYNAESGKELYIAELHWQGMMLAARRYLPFPSDVAVKVTLARDSMEVTQIRWTLPHSEIDAQAQLSSFVNPQWRFRYRGQFDLRDMRMIMRKPNTPEGKGDFSGEGTYADKKLGVAGRYSVREIVMRYKWFHAAGITSRGTYRADRHQLAVPDFEAKVLGGTVRGRVDLVFKGMKFRAQTRAQGMDLAALLAAVDRESFPVAALHWGGTADTDSVTTWTQDFKRVESRGLSLWAPPIEPRQGQIPASARLDYYWVLDRQMVELYASEISTPTSHIAMKGVLGARASGMDVQFETQDLQPWNDFIRRLKGSDSEELQQIAGKAIWQGRVHGPLDGPTFVGHAQGFQTSYGKMYWDEVEGDVTYSPDEFRLAHGQARRGRSAAQLELWLELDDWSFRQNNRWSVEASVTRGSTDDLQALLGWSYPARGLVSGQFRGSGTRADPELTGLFDVTEVEAWGVRVSRVRGQLGLRRDEIRISNAELWTLPVAAAPRNNGARPPGGGVITGNLTYRSQEQQIAFDITGAAVPLEGIERIQTGALPLGGRLSFHLSGKGPLRAPSSQGTLRVVDLRVGDEVLGSFEGNLNSDGRRVHLALNSAMAAGRLEGEFDLTLSGDYPMQGEITLQGVDIDPFIQTAFHLRALTGHSSVDGRFRLSGALARPETIAAEADISRLVFNYEYVSLENVGPLRLSYRRDEVRIEQAHLRGTETDFEFSGFARFAGDRRISMNLAGTVNMRLLGGFVPRLEARGPAQVNAFIEGTLSSPRINGRVHVENAAFNYGDFPAGLSRVTGDLVFDRNRLLFENVSAETGGGRMMLSGSVSYAERPARFDISARADRVRIRYPEGMSWLAGGTLRLSGTTQSGLLSGRVVVERLLMSRGFDLASFIVASQEPVRGPTTTSPFLRNLQFDIEAVSSPDARMEWTGARLESEANLRVRGTWENPILLGHIHLLGGELKFRGNRYRLTRGDINFANPFRLDPVLNVEAMTTIRQYEVTLNFTGPASKMTLAYRSDPPLPSSDIIALLALGRTGEESELRSPTAVQSPEMGATTLLTEAISSQLGGRLERLFGISRLRVDPFLAGTGTEQNAAARVTIEQQVTRDFVITYITNVTSTQQQVIQVEYNVNRNVSIIALRDQNGTFGLDVKFKKRFK